MNAFLRLPRRELRSGFTLIELLAVILIISILAAALSPMVLSAVGASEVSACQTNQGKIHQAFVQHEIKYRDTKFGAYPTASGVAFFSQLYQREAITPSKANAEMMTCPGVNKSALAIGSMDWEEWWTDTELVTGDYSAYAGRDTKNFPLRKMAANEPLLGDDNDGSMNHGTTTNVLFGDGDVRKYELKVLQEDGVLTQEEDVLLIGPDSPIEELRKLSLD